MFVICLARLPVSGLLQIYGEPTNLSSLLNLVFAYFHRLEICERNLDHVRNCFTCRTQNCLHNNWIEMSPSEHLLVKLRNNKKGLNYWSWDSRLGTFGWWAPIILQMTIAIVVYWCWKVCSISDWKMRFNHVKLKGNAYKVYDNQVFIGLMLVLITFCF